MRTGVRGDFKSELYDYVNKNTASFNVVKINLLVLVGLTRQYLEVPGKFQGKELQKALLSSL